MTLMLRTFRIGLTAALFALVTTIAPVAHAAAADLAGVWKGTMETQIGPAETTITIEPGAALAGKVQVMNYEGRIEKGSVDGEKVSFEVTIEPGTIATYTTNLLTNLAPERWLRGGSTL